MGGIAAFIDAEHALDPSYARKCGVDLDDLLISQPDTGEQALEIAETLVRSGAVDVVVVDSVAALVPRAEIEGDMGDAHVGLQARLMSQALRKLTGAINRSQHLGHLHQPAAREDRRDVRQPGDDLRRPRAEVLRLGAPGHPPRRDSIKSGTDVIGSRVARQGRQEQGRAAVQAGRVRHHVRRRASPTRAASSMSAWNSASCARAARGSTYGEERLGQGRENAKEFLKAQPGDAGGDLPPHPRPRGQGRR